MEIKGYKAFLPGLKVIDDTSLEIGKDYYIDKEIKYRISGFHFCERLEDTLRYFTDYPEIEICEVLGLGNIHRVDDEYYGYHDIYISTGIRIVRKVSKSEMLETYKQLIKSPILNDIRIARFLKYFPNLTEEDLTYMGAKNLKLPFYY